MLETCTFKNQLDKLNCYVSEVPTVHGSLQLRSIAHHSANQQNLSLTHQPSSAYAGHIHRRSVHLKTSSCLSICPSATANFASSKIPSLAFVTFVYPLLSVLLVAGPIISFTFSIVYLTPRYLGRLCKCANTLSLKFDGCVSV